MTKHKLEDRPTSFNRAERPQRTPIHGLRDKLSVKGQEPGFHYVWVNDYNTDSYEQGGYEFVTHAVQVGDKHIESSKVSSGRVSMPVGNGITGFLMRIPQEYYEEDQAELQNDISEKESAMKQDLNSGQDGRYGKFELGSTKPA